MHWACLVWLCALAASIANVAAACAHPPHMTHELAQRTHQQPPALDSGSFCLRVVGCGSQRAAQAQFKCDGVHVNNSCMGPESIVPLSGPADVPPAFDVGVLPPAWGCVGVWPAVRVRTRAFGSCTACCTAHQPSSPVAPRTAALTHAAWAAQSAWKSPGWPCCV